VRKTSAEAFGELAIALILCAGDASVPDASEAAS